MNAEELIVEAKERRKELSRQMSALQIDEFYPDAARAYDLAVELKKALGENDAVYKQQQDENAALRKRVKELAGFIRNIKPLLKPNHYGTLEDANILVP